MFVSCGLVREMSGSEIAEAENHLKLFAIKTSLYPELDIAVPIDR